MSQTSQKRSKLARTRGADYTPPSTRMKRTRGRPDTFDPEFIETAKKLSEAGATTQEIATAIGVDRVTLWHWANRNDEFFNAIKVGGRKADDRVKQTLYERAMSGESDTAAIFWLKNRDPNNWRDRRDVELTGTVNVESASQRQLAMAMLALVKEGVREPLTIEHEDANARDD